MGYSKRNQIKELGLPELISFEPLKEDIIKREKKLRVLLISANTEQIVMPVFPIGLAFVATATQKAGHDVKFINLMDENDRLTLLKGAIKDFSPEVIGISVRNVDDQSIDKPKFLLEAVKQVVKDCRSRSGAQIVLGGSGYTIYPQSVLDYLKADMGIQGEGEKAFVDLLAQMDKNIDTPDVPGLYLRGAGLIKKPALSKNLDDCAIPPPDDHPWIPSSALEGKGAWIPFQTRRGCPMNCSFCPNPVIEGRILRKQKIDHVIETLTQYANTGYTRFIFVDSTFNLPESYVENFCDRIISQRLKIKWFCTIYPIKTDEKRIEKMARAGCIGASLGFESGSNKILKNMNKKFDADSVCRVSKMLKKFGISRMGYLLLGGPGETRETVNESLHFAEKLNLESMMITRGMRIYPGTPLAKVSINEKVIGPDDDLLFPKFYMAKGLGDWLKDTVDHWAKNRPNWMI